MTFLFWSKKRDGVIGAGSGVDGVKVDVQATVGLMGSKLGGGPSMTLKYHQSLESSVQQSFPGNHCINCMCHSTENLYRYNAAATQGNHAHLSHTHFNSPPKALSTSAASVMTRAAS